VYRDHRQLLLLKENSSEVWYNSGAADFPFERISGVYIEHGIGAPDSAASGDNAVFWLNQYRQVVRYFGQNPQIISTEQIEYQFNQYTTVSNAKGYCYTQEGHSFYVLIFPSEGATWAYDSATGYWHERKSYPQTDGEYGRHRGNCFARFDDKNLIGDYENGYIYYYDLGTYTDNSETVIRQRTTQSIDQDRKKIFFHRLEVDLEAGVGLVSGQGSAPRMILEYSDDGGHTWSNEQWADMGAIGEYTQRALWRMLGASRNRIWKLTVTDPVKTVILGANLRATLGED
jgi:hypothetical protein